MLREQVLQVLQAFNSMCWLSVPASARDAMDFFTSHCNTRDTDDSFLSHALALKSAVQDMFGRNFQLSRSCMGSPVDVIQFEMGE